MAKNLKEFIQCGRDPAYLKNGDIITEELAWEVVGQEGYADGCLDQEFEITQSRIVEDIIGGEGVYETIYRERARTTHGNTSDCAQQEKIRTSRRSTPRQPTSAVNTEQKTKWNCSSTSGTPWKHAGRCTKEETYQSRRIFTGQDSWMTTIPRIATTE